jgi:hypothetical protein
MVEFFQASLLSLVARLQPEKPLPSLLLSIALLATFPCHSSELLIAFPRSLVKALALTIQIKTLEQLLLCQGEASKHRRSKKKKDIRLTPLFWNSCLEESILPFLGMKPGFLRLKYRVLVEIGRWTSHLFGTGHSA